MSPGPSHATVVVTAATSTSPSARAWATRRCTACARHCLWRSLHHLSASRQWLAAWQTCRAFAAAASAWSQLAPGFAEAAQPPLKSPDTEALSPSSSEWASTTALATPVKTSGDRCTLSPRAPEGGFLAGLPVPQNRRSWAGKCC